LHESAICFFIAQKLSFPTPREKYFDLLPALQLNNCILSNTGDRRGRMVVELTTTCEIVSYYLLSCEFEPHSWRGILDKTLCDQVRQ
jgi:hypothetical protein